MDDQYFNLLPLDIRALVADIERTSGIEIEVKVDSSRQRGLPEERDPIACEVDQYSATILLSAAHELPEGAVLHELLHIQRFLSQGIPRIVVCVDFDDWTPTFGTAITKLDNSLEHLVIVPEELRRRPEREEHWSRAMQRALNDLPSAQMSGDDRKRLTLIHWLFIKHVLPLNILRTPARALIEKLGIADRADRFVTALVPALSSKEKVVALCCEHLSLPTASVCLEYLDSQNGRSREVSLAEALSM